MSLEESTHALACLLDKSVNGNIFVGLLPLVSGFKFEYCFSQREDGVSSIQVSKPYLIIWNIPSDYRTIELEVLSSLRQIMQRKYIQSLPHTLHQRSNPSPSFSSSRQPFELCFSDRRIWALSCQDLRTRQGRKVCRLPKVVFGMLRGLSWQVYHGIHCPCLRLIVLESRLGHAYPSHCLQLSTSCFQKQLKLTI